jgi:hypothetical protein
MGKSLPALVLKYVKPLMPEYGRFGRLSKNHQQKRKNSKVFSCGQGKNSDKPNLNLCILYIKVSFSKTLKLQWLMPIHI